jgi:general secretion pathway protein K
MSPRHPRLRARGRQGGAAILLALLIMTLVATLAVGMVWVQWRGIEVESAERARGQGEWLLNAALDWGNLILKSSIRNDHKEDDLGQPWATPLAETKLSSFLSADGSHTEEGGPEAFLSGQITDAQSKYNLYNLVNDGESKTNEIVRLQILCTAVGVSPGVATTIAAGLRGSWSAQQATKAAGDQRDTTNAVLMPIEVDNLAWYGIDPAVVKQLQPFVQLLPASVVTPINVNTAPAEVLMAALPGISRAQAQQIILRRQASPVTSLANLWAALNLPNAKGWEPADPGPKNQVDWKSLYFEVYGQLRYEQHVIRERSVVYRKDQFSPVQVLRRERLPPDAT